MVTMERVAEAMWESGCTTLDIARTLHTLELTVIEIKVILDKTITDKAAVDLAMSEFGVGHDTTKSG